jgi:hypothetical protein
MRITVKRSGGFAGLSEELASVDTADLEAERAEQIEQLVGDISFFDLPTELSPDEVGADQFRYEITVSDDGREHTVTYQDNGGAEVAQLRRLVEALT